MQKKLLITFDYELFLGAESGSVDDCMIDPTRKIIGLLNKYGIHAVFFVDTVYLLRLKEMSSEFNRCREDFEKVSKQLSDLVSMGHYVYPHLHPHWLDAKYFSEKNYWVLNNTARYRFHNISETERDEIFSNSIHLLNSIIHPKNSTYKIEGHRAGGWSIQPFTDFKSHYEKHNITYDFSVMSGFYQFTDAQYFDFTNAPEKSVYRFSSDICSEDPSGPFVQFGISSHRINAVTNFVNKIWLKYQYKILKDHTFENGIGQAAKEVNGTFPVSSNGRNLTNTEWERISIELLTSVKLGKYLRFLESSDYMHFISHPKMITNHNLSIFDKFLEKVFEKYSIETDFHLMIP